MSDQECQERQERQERHERRAAILRKIDDAPNAQAAEGLQRELEVLDGEPERPEFDPAKIGFIAAI